MYFSNGGSHFFYRSININGFYANGHVHVTMKCLNIYWGSLLLYVSRIAKPKWVAGWIKHSNSPLRDMQVAYNLTDLIIQLTLILNSNASIQQSSLIWFCLRFETVSSYFSSLKRSSNKIYSRSKSTNSNSFTKSR